MIMRKSFLFVVMAGIALCACGCGSDEAGKVSEQNAVAEYIIGLGEHQSKRY